MSIQSAEENLAKARADLDRWRQKLQEAKAEAARLESDVATLDAPEKIDEAARERAFAITDAQSVIDFAVKGAEAAEEKERKAFRELVEAHEAEATDRIKAKSKELDKLRKQLAGPLAKLKELNGVEYVPKPGRDRLTGLNVAPPTEESELGTEVWTLQVQRSMLRYWLTSGKVAKFVRLGTKRHDGNPDVNPTVVADPGRGGQWKQIPREQQPEVLDRAPAPPPEPAIDPAKVKVGSPVW